MYSWMFESLSAFGSRVQTPCGPRKSGIPESVEMPAPVSATTRLDLSTHLLTMSMSLLIGILELKYCFKEKNLNRGIAMPRKRFFIGILVGLAATLFYAGSNIVRAQTSPSPPLTGLVSSQRAPPESQ